MDGIVYRYQLNVPDIPQTGWSYIGQTTDETHRKANWKCETAKYGGQKLMEARKMYGTADWDYTTLKTVSAPTEKELKKLLKQEEAAEIKRYGSDINGFNTRHVQKVSVLRDDGTIEEYDTVLEAALAHGLFPASVYYSAQRGSSTREKGLKFKIW